VKEMTMSKRIWAVSGCVAAVAIITLAAGSVRAGDGDRFQGTWRVTFAEIGKSEATGAQLRSMKIMVDGDKLTLVEGDSEEVVHFDLDPTTRPHRIEFFRGPAKKVKKWHGIYVFDGRKLKLCWGPAGSDRPTRFSANESNENRLFVIERR
jgi:uncharacterized protein (TIGR03067 family)